MEGTTASQAPRDWNRGPTHHSLRLCPCDLIKIREVTGAGSGNEFIFGLWLSLVERLVRDQEAVGSNPTSPILALIVE
jgi:hypothetical protein